MTLNKIKTVLLLAYGFTYVFFVTYFITNTIECEAFWMHDASIGITHKGLIVTCSYLFLIPICFLVFQYKTKLSIRAFITQYICSLISIALLALSLNEPLKIVDGVNYMFIDALLVLGYYVFKLISFAVIGYIIFKSIASLIKQKR